MKAVEDVERGDGRAGAREAALVKKGKIVSANVDVLKQDAQVLLDRRRAVQPVKRLLRLERVFGRADDSLRLKSAAGRRTSGTRAALADA